MKFTHKIFALSLLMVSGFAFASQPEEAPVVYVFTTAQGRAEFLKNAASEFEIALFSDEAEETYNDLTDEVTVSGAGEQTKADLHKILGKMLEDAKEKIGNAGLIKNVETISAKWQRIANEKTAKAKEFYAKHPTAVNGTAIAGGVAVTGAGLVAAYKKSPKVKENVDAAAKYTKETAVIAADWAAKKAAAAKAAVVAKFEQLENTPLSRADAIIATGTVALGMGAYKCLPSFATTQTALTDSYDYAKNRSIDAGIWVSGKGVAISTNDKVVSVVEHVKKHQKAYGSAVVVATTSALGYAAYRYYTAPKKATVVVPVTKVQVIDEEEVLPNYNLHLDNVTIE